MCFVQGRIYGEGGDVAITPPIQINFKCVLHATAGHIEKFKV